MNTVRQRIGGGRPDQGAAACRARSCAIACLVKHHPRGRGAQQPPRPLPQAGKQAKPPSPAWDPDTPPPFFEPAHDLSFQSRRQFVGSGAPSFRLPQARIPQGAGARLGQVPVSHPAGAQRFAWCCTRSRTRRSLVHIIAIFHCTSCVRDLIQSRAAGAARISGSRNPARHGVGIAERRGLAHGMGVFPGSIMSKQSELSRWNAIVHAVRDLRTHLPGG